MCTFHYFNYYLPDFVTVIYLGFIFEFSFLDVFLNLTMPYKTTSGIFVPDQRSSPMPLEWEHRLQDPRLSEN